MDATLGFIGSYELSSDGKGRIMLPVPFRKLVSNKLVLMCRTERAVAAFTPETFNKLLESEARPVFESNLPTIRRMLGSAMEVNVESNWRFTVPEAMRRYCGMDVTSQVIVVGTGDSFEIWTLPEFAAYAREAFKDTTVREEALLTGARRLP